MKQVADGIALANDMEVEVEYTKLYPAMFNTPELVEKASPVMLKNYWAKSAPSSNGTEPAVEKISPLCFSQA